MIVRNATKDDLAQYVELANDFHTASPMNGIAEFDREGYATFYINALNNPDIGIWLAEIDSKIVGITGAMVYPLYFSPTHLVAQELWWWLTPTARGSGAGAKMFNQIEQWAKEKNAKSLFMIALEDNRADKMEKVYIRAGFTPLERTFVKEVK
jgi:RimJ/RimL family protein N-acetyltransferase